MSNVGRALYAANFLDFGCGREAVYGLFAGCGEIVSLKSLGFNMLRSLIKIIQKSLA